MNVTLIEEREGNLASINIYSKLIENRIIFINDDITDELSGEVIAQLLYLDSLNNNVINIYINTPGGSIFAGLSGADWYTKEFSRKLPACRTAGAGFIHAGQDGDGKTAGIPLFSGSR